MMKSTRVILILIFFSSFLIFAGEPPLKNGARVVASTKMGFLEGVIKSHRGIRGSYKVRLSSGKSLNLDYDKIFRIGDLREKDLNIKNYILYQNDGKYEKSTIIKKVNPNEFLIQIHGINPMAKRLSVSKNKLVAYVSENLRLGGEYCSRVNLLRHKWTKEWNMPQYDQGFTELCYGYTGIQMFDYWRQTKGLRVTKDIALSDAIYGGLLTRMISYREIDDLQGGNTYKVLSGIRRYGMCRPDVIQNSLKEFALKLNIDSREFYEAILNYVTRKRSWSNFDGFWDAFQNKLVNAARGGVIRLFKKRKVYSKANFKLIYEKLKPYIDKGNLTAFYMDVFKDCPKKGNYYLNSKKLPYPRQMRIEGAHNEGIKDKFYSKLHSLLDEKKVIGIDYCANVLSFKNSKNFKKNNQVKNGCMRHASLIVGRRVHEGNCQLLVRNSWGTNCRYPWECLKNAKGEEMGVWVNEKAMRHNLYRLTYIP